MIFTETAIPGAFVVDLEPRADERGFFARGWCAREFAEHGLDAALVQHNISFNRRTGTVRGMHYQADPHPEVKVVRCTRGRLFDVIVDLRPGSPSYCRWAGVELSAENRRALYIPAGVAHGFQTLADDTEVHYQMSDYYHPELARGVRWDDPAFGIAWPSPATAILSERDRSYADFAAR